MFPFKFDNNNYKFSFPDCFVLMTPVSVLSDILSLFGPELWSPLRPWTPTYWCSSSGSRCPACGIESPRGVWCEWGAEPLPGCSEPVRTWTAASSSSLRRLWVVVAAAAWVCRELEAGPDGKTSRESRWEGGAPLHGPGGAGRCREVHIVTLFPDFGSLGHKLGTLTV